MRLSSPEDSDKGPIAWMVQHRVAPNLLMLLLLLGGFALSLRIKKEVFPEFDLPRVVIRVAYPGASPEEVERGVILAVEEAVRGLDGIDEIRSTVTEGSGTVTVELREGADRQKAYQEIQQEVDRIRTFPEDIERPEIFRASRRREVLSVQLYGMADEWSMREIAEDVRDRLLHTGRISQIDLGGVRDFEISIEIEEADLRAYGLTLRDVARRIDASSVELPAGAVKTRGGEILLRFRERKDWASQFEDIPIITSTDGTLLRLGEIATVSDTFEDVDQEAGFNGQRTIELEVFRVADETPIGISDAVREALVDIEADLPDGIHVAVRSDRSEIYRQRLELLLRNGFLGLCLVLALLGLFLEFKLAFWVTMGIPTSFLGALLFLSTTDVTINVMSMFAFIVALGIVVDDAIVAGENIYEYRQQGLSAARAAILGAKDVAVPIAFSILTNIIAFLPLAFIEGTLGMIWGVLPLVVGTVFVISWVEALFILPAHLAHVDGRSRTSWGLSLHRAQQRFSRAFSRAVARYYGPFIRTASRYRYVTMACALTCLMVLLGYALSGRMGFILMPKVESDRAVVTARLPYGSPLSHAQDVSNRLVEGAEEVTRAHGGDVLCEGVFSTIEANRVQVTAYLTPPDIRPMSTAAFTDMWRDEVGLLIGPESVRYESDRGGPGRGPSVTVELSHRDIGVLDRASAELARRLTEFAVIKDVDDGYTPGKPQFDFVLTEAGRSLGLTSASVARQVRDAFYGAEALRQQRGRNEVKVMVRRPRAQRTSEHDVEQLLIRTPSGRDVPLREIARVERGRAFTSIDRRDGRRTVTVSANVNPISETNRVLTAVKDDVLPSLVEHYPGLRYSFEGRQAAMRDALDVMKSGSLISLVLIYILLAIPFRSYAQPLIVLGAIPFGLVGAVIGHEIMDYNLSIISLFGIIALTGVLVNDALVMVDYANKRQRREGLSAFDAINLAAVRRFRPILLTTLTTFGGLAPMIFETSRQARFMIPMAISLGYGILFATAITLLVVPCLFLIVDDALQLRRRLFLFLRSPSVRSPSEESSSAAS